jgi:hypothetical protein
MTDLDRLLVDERGGFLHPVPVVIGAVVTVRSLRGRLVAETDRGVAYIGPASFWENV